jgi:hypothetical protein
LAICSLYEINGVKKKKPKNQKIKNGKMGKSKIQEVEYAIDEAFSKICLSLGLVLFPLLISIGHSIFLTIFFLFLIKIYFFLCLLS